MFSVVESYSLIHSNQHSQHPKKYKKTETQKHDETQDGK